MRAPRAVRVVIGVCKVIVLLVVVAGLVVVCLLFSAPSSSPTPLQSGDPGQVTELGPVSERVINPGAGDGTDVIRAR